MKVLRIERVEIVERGEPTQGLRISIHGPGGEEWIEGNFEPWVRDWLNGDEQRLTMMSSELFTAFGAVGA